MLKSKPQYSDLPKLQRKITLCLAEHKPMNISDTNKKINGHESATNLAIHKLESKGIIQKVENYEYHNREFSKYWLTERGVAFALMNGAKAEKVKDIALKVNIEKTYFDLRSISPKIANILDTIVLFHGMISPEDLTRRLTLEVASLGETEIETFLEALKESGKFDDALRNTRDMMKKFLERMEKSGA
jgi:DNA-binding MarR family transcriptional regulator